MIPKGEPRLKDIMPDKNIGAQRYPATPDCA
jgi:hypothetical protein